MQKRTTFCFGSGRALFVVFGLNRGKTKNQKENKIIKQSKFLSQRVLDFTLRNCHRPCIYFKTLHFEVVMLKSEPWLFQT